MNSQKNHNTLENPSLLTKFFRMHLREARLSILELAQKPISSIMTISIVAIALALPMAFTILVNNAKAITKSFDTQMQISIYLNPKTSDLKVKNFITKLNNNEAVTSVTFISKETGLAEFKKSTGFANIESYLPSNPLPDVLLVNLDRKKTTPDKASKMLAQFKAMKEVDIAKLDLEWVQRLHAIIHLSERLMYAIEFILFFSVLLIIGNAIRLFAQDKKEHIAIAKIIGATDAFIRRPFLYTGMWYGVLGAIAGWLLIGTTFIWLYGPVKQLSALYNNPLSLKGLDLNNLMLLLLFGLLLGLGGAYLSVGRQLRNLEAK